MWRASSPDGEPTLPDSFQERYDHLDLRFAIGVLMGNRDLTRRLAAEAGVPAPADLAIPRKQARRRRLVGRSWARAKEPIG